MTEDPLRRRARDSANGPAVVSSTTRWSWSELDAAAGEVAVHLTDRGIGTGSIVSVELPNGPVAVAAAHGVPRTGASVTFGDTRWTPEERKRFYEMVQPAAVIHPSASAPKIGPLSSEPLGGRAAEGRDVSVSLPAATRVGAWGAALEDTHAVLWTSGSDGRPSAVRLSMANHLASAAAVARRLALADTDGWLASLALCHIGGFEMVMRCAALGSRLHLAGSRFDADRVSRALDEGAITHLSLVPAMLRLILERRAEVGVPEGLRCVLVGGDTAPADLLIRAIAEGYPVALTYGLTEATSQVATAPPELVRRKPGTAGPPLDGVEVRITRHEEILVRGPTVMQGYLGAEPEAEVFEGGWLRTGDLGRLDEEGHLRVTGRRSQRIVTGGVNVDPVQVERVLSEHPQITDVAVVGIEDPEWGQRIAAVVTTRGDDVGREALDLWARDRLSGARRPRMWLLMRELPHTRTGKPDRAAIVGLVREAEARAAGSPSGAEPEDGA